MQGEGERSEGNQIMNNSTSGNNSQTAPTALDALKYACLNGIDSIDFVVDRLAQQEDVDEPDSETGAMYSILVRLGDQLHEALQSQVTYQLLNPTGQGTSAVPHSNTYEAARFFSDGTPVYVDTDCSIPAQDEDGVTYLNRGHRREFGPLPGGDAA